jgi:hypothetical protein
MSDNKALWNRVSKTDPKQVKPITGKQYSGNSPKPYYIVERLTEEFGPCGIGWGFTILNERMERLTDDDVLHVAVVRLWYEQGGKRGELEQIGQTKAVYKTSKGSMLVDEDAPKKSVTDALVKCASYLGFAGDIFSGRWDDSKYVAELRKEFAEQSDSMLAQTLKASIEAEKTKKQLQAVGIIKPTEGAGKGLSDERRAAIEEIALHLVDCHRAERDVDAVRIWYAPDTFLDNDERVYCWHLLAAESKLRSTIKASKPEAQKA